LKTSLSQYNASVKNKPWRYKLLTCFAGLNVSMQCFHP